MRFAALLSLGAGPIFATFAPTGRSAALRYAVFLRADTLELEFAHDVLPCMYNRHCHACTTVTPGCMEATHAWRARIPMGMNAEGLWSGLLV